MTVVAVDRCPRWTSPRRAARLRDRFDDAGIDALLVTHLPNVRYLTGFTGSGRDAARHRRRAGVHDRRPLPHPGRRAARAAGVDARIEIGATVRPASATRSRAALAAAAPRSGSRRTRSPGPSSATFADGGSPGASSSPTDGSSSELRRVKEPAEVARIRAACAIADDALGVAAPDARRAADRARLRARRSRSRCADRGASGNSFDPIVASGPNGGEAARPPERPAHRARRAGRHRLRVHRRRVLLRHDPHRERRRSRSRGRGTSGTSCARASAAGRDAVARRRRVRRRSTGRVAT